VRAVCYPKMNLSHSNEGCRTIQTSFKRVDPAGADLTSASRFLCHEQGCRCLRMVQILPEESSPLVYHSEIDSGACAIADWHSK
jgi:hypothetical protein